MAKFCGKCGSEIDKKTGLCPNCDATALEKVTEANTKKSLKKAKRRGFSAIIALILVIAIVVSSVILAISKGWIGNNSEEEKKKVQTTYVTYLNKTIIPEIGEYDADHPESSNEGVHSALFCDLNNDDTDEFLVAYSKADNSKISFNVSCYEYNEDAAQTPSTDNETDTNTDEAVDLMGTVTPFSEEDYTDNKKDVYHIPNATLVYSIEYNNKTYIVCEHISWLNTYSYECYIYSLENGVFVEISNLFVPDIGTTGIRIVYSSKLPDGLEIDNSGFDYSKAKDSGVAENDGNFVLYFCEGGNSDYIFDNYYKSEDEAVSDFLSYFGISKSAAVNYEDNIPRLVCPDGAEPIFSYMYYFEYNDDGDTIDKYEINDYTDWKSLLNESGETTDESADLSQNDIFSYIQRASEYTNEFFSHDRYDYDKTMKYHDEKNDWDVDCFYMKSDSIKTWDDFCKSGESSYSKEAIDKYFNSDLSVPHIDGEDGLYVYWDGLGSTTQFIYFTYEKVDSYEYKIIEYDFAGFGGDFEPYEEEFKLTYENGQWLFDKVFSYEVYYFLESKYVIDKSDNINFDKFNQIYEYTQLLNKAYDEFEFENYCEYYIYDINNDGTYELILHTGTCEQDRTYTFYSYNNGKAVELGSDNAWHAGLYNDKSGNLVSYEGSQGTYNIRQYSISNNALKIDNLASNEELTNEKSTWINNNYDSISMLEMYEIETLHNQLFN